MKIVRNFTVFIAWAIILGGSPANVPAAQAETNPGLDNGFVKLTFDAHTGQFELRPTPDSAMVLTAGPSLEFDGRKISASEASHVKVSQEDFKDELGAGEKLIVEYEFSGAFPGFRYELREYAGKPWLTVTAFLPKGDYRLSDFAVVEGKLQVPEAVNARVYVNSGSSGGNTGVWHLGMRRLESANLSVVYAPKIKMALGMGFYSFYRASSSVVTQYWSAVELSMTSGAHYNGYKPASEDLRTESVLLDFGADPLKLLDEWTDAAVSAVHPQFNHNTRTGFINTWYAFGDAAYGDVELQQARILRDSILPGYGITFVELGEWQTQRHQFGDVGDDLGFGDDQLAKDLFPHGVGWLCDQYHALGFGCSFGANYAYAAWESPLVKQGVPWLVREDRSRMAFGVPIDFTDPAAQKWVYNLYHQAADFNAKWVWSDFDGGPTRGSLHDPTKIRGFEDIREGLKAIRAAVGPDTFIHRFCCGPYFTYVGLADKVRTGQDMVGVGDWTGLEAVARELAGTYMLHQHFWINDPDPLYVGGRDYVHNEGTGPIPSDALIRNEVRMRLQLQMTSGSFVTIGENMEDLDAERLHLLTMVLPTYGQAARPLDLFTHTIPEVYDLPVKADWDNWHVLMLQNWNDSNQAYRVDFAQMGLDREKDYLVYRFWDQTFLGEYRGDAEFSVGGHEGETYAIREKRPYPWVLSTDMNLTQGGVDLQEVKYDREARRLSGTASRHPGAEGRVVLFVPPGYEVSAASDEYRTTGDLSSGKLVYLRVKFQAATTPWFVEFNKRK